MLLNNSILTNINAISICNDLKLTNSALSRALERMSSGLKVNGAKDDAAGSVISAKMQPKINGIFQAQNNI